MDEPTPKQLEQCEFVFNGVRCELTKWAHIKYDMNHVVAEPFWDSLRTEFIKNLQTEKKDH